MGGTCFALGEIEINDPEYYFLYLGAQASYYVSGQTMIDLYGDIE